MKHDTETLTECRRMDDAKLERWIRDRIRANNYGAARLGRAVQEERAGGLPVENIHWRDVPKGARVFDSGGCFVVETQDGKRAVAFWTGQENDIAQDTLWHHARRTEKNS